jgi:hypothetical protein
VDEPVAELAATIDEDPTPVCRVTPVEEVVAVTLEEPDAE